jgi:hypothetical protein
MPTLINMQMSAEEAQEETQPKPADAPKYPWGLCIDLDDETIEKLGLSKLPDAGTEVHLVAKAVVSSTSQYDTQGGETESRMSLQITDMAIANLEALNASQQLNSLYPKTFGK